MGLLDDAIREHLDLKRRRGADPSEIERAEREALGPVRRSPEELEEEGLAVGLPDEEHEVCASEPHAEPEPHEEWEAPAEPAAGGAPEEPVERANPEPPQPSREH